MNRTMTMTLNTKNTTFVTTKKKKHHCSKKDYDVDVVVFFGLAGDPFVLAAVPRERHVVLVSVVPFLLVVLVLVADVPFLPFVP